MYELKALDCIKNNECFLHFRKLISDRELIIAK